MLAHCKTRLTCLYRESSGYHGALCPRCWAAAFASELALQFKGN